MQIRKLTPIVAFVIAALSMLYYCILDGNNYLQKYIAIDNRKNIKFYVDSEFTNEEVSAIRIAANEWMEVIDTLTIKIEIRKIEPFEMFHFGSDGRATIYKASGIGFKHDVGRLAANEYNAIGLSLINSGDIFIFINNEYFNQVVKHEIGHVLIGYSWHSANPKSVMFPVTNGKNNEIMQEEIDLIKERHNVH